MPRALEEMEMERNEAIWERRDKQKEMGEKAMGKMCNEGGYGRRYRKGRVERLGCAEKDQ